MKFLTSEWRERSKCNWGKLKGAQSCYISFMSVRIAVTPLCLCLRGTTACNESEKYNMCLNKDIHKGEGARIKF